MNHEIAQDLGVVQSDRIPKLTVEAFVRVGSLIWAAGYF